MKNHKEPATFDDPLVLSRVAPYVGDVSKTGATLVAELSEKINQVSVIRSMQIGYMLACQDFALPVPDFKDPAEFLLNVKV
jgi:hypothetical protein